VRAVVIREFGPPEVLEPAEVDEVRAGPDEVVIDVEFANVTFVDRLAGWKVNVARVNAHPMAPYEVQLQRSPSTMLFAITILCIFVAIAAVGLFVAIQTTRDPRRFQSPMTTWYAAMLFAVVPLRNALPGSPAFGSWIDLTIVLWVLVALVVSMLLYIGAWWRATSRATSKT